MSTMSDTSEKIPLIHSHTAEEANAACIYVDVSVQIRTIGDIDLASQTFACLFELCLTNLVSKKELQSSSLPPSLRTKFSSFYELLVLEMEGFGSWASIADLFEETLSAETADTKQELRSMLKGPILKIFLLNSKTASAQEKSDIYEFILENSFLHLDSLGDFHIARVADCSGIFKQRYNLRSFPFDVQDLTVHFEVIHVKKWHRDIKVRLAKHPLNCKDHLEDLSEWQMPRLKISLQDKHVSFSLCVARNFWSYFFRIMFVLALVTATAMPAFGLPPVDGFGDRLAHIATMLLTGVAFLNMVFSMIPNIPYLTFLDVYVTASIVFLAAEIAVVTMTSLEKYESYDTFFVEWSGILYASFQLFFVLYAVVLRCREFQKMTSITYTDSTTRLRVKPESSIVVLKDGQIESMIAKESDIWD